MKIDRKFDNYAKKAVLSCLGRVPFLRVEEIPNAAAGEGIRPGLLVKVRPQDR